MAHTPNSPSITSLDFPLPPLTTSSCTTSRSRSSSIASSMTSIDSPVSPVTLFTPQYANYGSWIQEPKRSVAVPKIVLDGPGPLVVDEGPFPPTPRNDQFELESDPVRSACRSFVTNQPIRLAKPPQGRFVGRHEHSTDVFITDTDSGEMVRFSWFTKPAQNPNSNYMNSPRSFEGEKRLCEEARNLLARGRARSIARSKLSREQLRPLEGQLISLEASPMDRSGKRRWWA